MVASLLQIVGLGAISIGLGLFSIPLGIVAGGVSCLIIGVALERGN